MKSKDLRKKTLSDYSSQDELSKERALKAELNKRSKKPSIYDELDDDFDDFPQLDDDEDDDLIDDDDDDEDFDDEDDDDRY